MRKMVRILALVLCMVGVMSFMACGTKEKEGKDSKGTEQSVAVGETENTESDTEEEEKDSLLPITYRSPKGIYYVNAPNYQEIEQGYTELFIVHESKYVAVTTSRKEVAESLEDAHNKAFDMFKSMMQNYEGGVNSLSVTNDEVTTINGMEVYYFEGTINYGRNQIHDGYAVGYSFIREGVPCSIIGGVIDDDQPEELKEEIKEVVSQMIETVRSEQ